MKKLNINTIKNLCKYSVASLMAILFASGMLSCEIGLGPGVDMQAPVVKITSHQDNDSVAQTFVLRGTASDNEGLTNLTIDFEDADIHYKVNPGDSWQKKTSASGHWVTIPSDDNNYCKKSGDKWKWAIAVDTGDKNPKKKGSTFNLIAVAEDDMGNSGKDSKVERSLIVDTENPSVSIYNPDLFSGTFEDINATLPDYTLKNGNQISRLLNGTISFKGRQSNALSFKELRIEFDNGQLESDKRKVTTADSVETIDDILALPASNLGDSSIPDVYFSKTLKSNDLREWSLSVKAEEWATNEAGKAYGLDTGKHLIRVVTTSLSTSNAWERKVIGYFIWWPEADRPWINITACDDNEYEDGAVEASKLYPGSDIPGNIQDDDGIKSFVSTLYKKDSNGNYIKYVKEGYTNPQTHALPQSSGAVKYSAWSVKAPSEKGQYKLELTVTDINGKSDTIIKYFQTSDVSAPKINITSPKNNTTAILAANGNIEFTGKVTDDGEIKSFIMVWLNPAKRSDSQNKIKYLTGTDSNWDKATTAGYTDEAGNILYKFDVGTGKKEYTIIRTFNLFSNFNIGQEIINGKVSKPLVTQDFIFRASDGISNTVTSLSLSGDTLAPTLQFDSITLNGTKKTIAETPTFPPIKNGDKATITGIWYDYFRDSLKNTTKIHKIEISWGNQKAQATPNSNGQWSVEITAPAEGGTITASIQDYAGNKRTVQGAARIETNELGLARIGCNNDDKSYKQGDILELTLEFTKNTKVTGTPKLKLNNGETAIYKSGSGTASHIFEYVVAEGLTDTTAIENVSIEKLSVSAIQSNGAKWVDSATGDDVTSKITIANLKTGMNLDDTRSIKIDTKAPKVERITAVTANGWYNSGSILFMLEFDEDVEITNKDALKMQFKHKRNSTLVTTDSTEISGSKAVLLTYDIKAGDNENPGDNANPLAFDKLLSGASVTDLAGNSLSSWTPKNSPAFSNIIIDTEKPDAPKIYTAANSTTEWNPDSVIFDSNGTKFAIKGDTGNTIEYTTDGLNWLPYSGEVTLSNNGTYHVSAKQIDKAGNESDPTDVKDIVIDKGALLTRITADTVNGTYSTNTSTTTIKGKIEFRKAVTIVKGAKVTLNVKNGTSTSKEVAIKECKDKAATSNIFTFDYEIKDGDSINADDGLLDVTGWTIEEVTFKDTNNNDVTVPMTFSEVTAAKKFSANRQIKVVTGNPVISAIDLSGEGEEAVLKVTFDRDITKVGGYITFEQDTSSGKYKVPAVLSVSEYNELKSNEAVKKSYTKGVNGALKEGNNLKNDTTTKYILNFDVTDTNKDLVNAFKAANKHKVTIPVVSSAVSVTNKKVLTVTLGSAYKLPVKGADYTLTIDEDIVTDEVQNKNKSKTQKLTAAGVEPPVIRIEKSSQTITGAGNTQTASVTMPETAKMHMNCRTPEATIQYGISGGVTNGVAAGIKSELVNVNQQSHNYTTDEIKTAKANSDNKATVPTTYTYTYSAPVTLGDGNNTTNTLSYATANGLKFAIAAIAQVGTPKSEPSYEYATRTVLKFRINGTYAAQDGSQGSTRSNITEGGNRLTFQQLRVWLMGGDFAYGANTIDPFPLEWSYNVAEKRSYFKLMAGDKNTNRNDMNGNWYWISWDVNAPTYHGFAIGDVPTDAQIKGPTKWYASEQYWCADKAYYVLYPGETLKMAASNDETNDGTHWQKTGFMFRIKNEGKR